MPVCPSVCLPFRKEKVGKAFHESIYCDICRKSVEEIQVSLKSEQNSGHFTWRGKYIYDGISLSSYYSEKRFNGSCSEKQNILCSVFFFSKIMPFMRKCVKNIVKVRGYRWQYGACALHAGYLMTQTHTKYTQYSLGL